MRGRAGAVFVGPGYEFGSRGRHQPRGARPAVTWTTTATVNASSKRWKYASARSITSRPRRPRRAGRRRHHNRPDHRPLDIALAIAEQASSGTAVHDHIRKAAGIVNFAQTRSLAPRPLRLIVGMVAR